MQEASTVDNLISKRTRYEELISDLSSKILMKHPTLSEIMTPFLYHVQCYRLLEAILSQSTPIAKLDFIWDSTELIYQEHQKTRIPKVSSFQNIHSNFRDLYFLKKKESEFGAYKQPITKIDPF